MAPDVVNHNLPILTNANGFLKFAVLPVIAFDDDPLVLGAAAQRPRVAPRPSVAFGHGLARIFQLPFETSVYRVASPVSLASRGGGPHPVPLILGSTLEDAMRCLHGGRGPAVVLAEDAFPRRFATRLRGGGFIASVPSGRRVLRRRRGVEIRLHPGVVIELFFNPRYVGGFCWHARYFEVARSG